MFALKVCTKTWNFDYASVGGVPEAYGSRRVFVSEFSHFARQLFVYLHDH